MQQSGYSALSIHFRRSPDHTCLRLPFEGKTRFGYPRQCDPVHVIIYDIHGAIRTKLHIKRALDTLAEDLKCWCEKAAQHAPFKSFVKGIQQDFEAVYQAMASCWSNGQSEGQVNRLKNIKRQMYGRASFELLRLRVLANSGWFHQI